MDRREEALVRPLFATVAYAEAFGLGTIDLPEWQTALLNRSIPGTEWFDALGCYPLTVFGPAPDLQAGRERLRAAGLVSVALVPDPITSPSPHVFSAVFEICRPFKTHYLIDREAGPVHFAKNHRWSVRQAGKHCGFEAIDLRENLEVWLALYRHTLARHQATGIYDFAPAYFRALAEMPAVTALAARHEGEIVAIILWVRNGEIVYAHVVRRRQRRQVGTDLDRCAGGLASNCVRQYRRPEPAGVSRLRALGIVDFVCQIERAYRVVPRERASASLDEERL